MPTVRRLEAGAPIYTRVARAQSGRWQRKPKLAEVIRIPDPRITNVPEENLPQSPESLKSPESQEPNKTETTETEENPGDA